MTEKFICFDIGGTKIFKAVVEINFAKRSFEFLDSKRVENPVDAEAIKKIILEYSEQAKDKFDTEKVAISSAKIVDYDNLKITQAKNIYGEDEFGFNFLKKAGYQVVLENDGEAFALGERYFDDNEDKQGLLTLAIGSGIGGGFINSEGHVLRGKNNSATEFSHMKMFIRGRWERWEDISAGRGIEKIYQEETDQIRTAKEVFNEAQKNPEAREVIRKTQEYLGQGVANLIDVFNPEKIVFGGSIASQEGYLKGAMEIAGKNIFYKKAFPEWSISELKAEMNVLGVCALYYI